MHFFNSLIQIQSDKSVHFSFKKMSFLMVVVIFVFSLFWQENELTTEFLKAFYPASFLICLIGIFNLKKGSEIKIYNFHIMVIFLIFIILNFMSVFWSVYPAGSLWEASKLFMYFYIFVISSQYFEEQRLKKIAVLMMFLGAFEVLLSVYNFLFVKRAAFTLATYSGRAMGTFPGPNGFAVYLLMIFMLASGFLFQKASRKEAVSYFVLMSVIVCGIVLSASRGVWICGIISLAFFIFGVRKNLKKIALFISIVILGVVLAVGIINASLNNNAPVQKEKVTYHRHDRNNEVKSVVVSRVHVSLDKIKSFNQRIPIWQAAGEMIKEKPLTGYGLGTFERMYGSFQHELKEYPHYVHNNYLQVFSETGVLSFVVFLIFTFLNLKEVYKSFLENKAVNLGVGGAVLAFTLHTAIDFDWNFFAITSFFFFILGSFYGRKSNGLKSDGRSESNEEPKFVRFIVKKRHKCSALIVLVLIGVLVGTQILSRLELENSYRLIQNKMPLEAREKAKTTSILMPIDPLPYKVLSDTYLFGNDRDIKEALQLLRKATRYDSYNAWYYNDLGQLLLYQKDYQGAAACFTQALKLNKTELDFYLNLGGTLIRLGQNDKAEEVLARGFSLRNTVPKYFFDQTKPEVKEKTYKIAVELIKLYNEQNRNNRALQIKNIYLNEYPDMKTIIKND